MKNLPTQKRALEKRDALIAAAGVCFTVSGYDATTAKTIAVRAGVATGTFYQYFDNKDDMLAVIARQRFDYLRGQVTVPVTGDDDAPVERLFERILRLIYDFHEQDPGLHQVLEHRRFIDPGLADILDEGEALLQGRVLRFVQSFNLPNANTITFNLFAMAEGLVHRHVFYAGQRPVDHPGKDQVIELGADMLASYFREQT